MTTDRPTVDRARIERLATAAYICLAASSAYFWFTSPWGSLVLNLQIILIAVLGVLPIIWWLKRHDDTYPLMEVMLIVIVPFYGLPMVMEHERVVLFPESTLIKSASVVVVFQLSIMAGAAFASYNHVVRNVTHWWQRELFPEGKLHLTAYTFLLTILWLLVAAFTDWVPQELLGTFRAIFFGIGIVSAFLQARLWGLGLLHQQQKIFFFFSLCLYCILASVSLLLITSLTLLLLVLVGYFSSSRRVPILAFVIVLPLFVVLHAGKAKMRSIYWGDYAKPVTLTDLPSFYVEWFQYGLEAGGNLGGDEEFKGSSLFERASLIQIVCFTVDVIPEKMPYLDGQSYSIVPPQVIPRFLWPNKPSPNESMKILAVHLGLLTAEQAETTSIGFGLIAEAFANAGFLSVLLLGFSLGWAMRHIALGTATCGTLSAGGIFRILCIAWCLSSEVTLAVWLSSFYQACIAIFVPLYAYRNFTGGATET
jgi:hypothetical protein